MRKGEGRAYGVRGTPGTDTIWDGARNTWTDLTPALLGLPQSARRTQALTPSQDTDLQVCKCRHLRSHQIKLVSIS